MSQTFSIDMAAKFCNILKPELKKNVGLVAVGYPLSCTLWDNTSCRNGRLSTMPFDYYGQDPKFPNIPSSRTQTSGQSISCVERYPTPPAADGRWVPFWCCCLHREANGATIVSPSSRKLSTKALRRHLPTW